MAFLIPLAATAALNAGWISVGAATAISSVAGVLGTVGSVVSGLGILSKGASDSSTANTNAALANYNAQIAARNSAQSLAAADEAATEQRQDTARRIGAIRGAFGNAGVVTTSGSPLLAVADQAQQGEFEAQKILYKGKLQSQGFDAESAIQSLMSTDYTQKASSARVNSFMSAGGAILTGRSLLA